MTTTTTAADLIMFADPDWDLRELPTGHWAMFSAPEQVARTLDAIAA